jgi:DNA-binding SARP family transcriptional activator
MQRGIELGVHAATAVHIADLGRPTILVEGREVRPRIAKSVALLAYLATAPGHEAEREELLGALFDGRADDSARSYLRQAVHRLREVLPEGIGPAFDGSRLRFGAPVALSGDAGRAEALLAEAARVQGEDRAPVLAEALALLDRGEYLDGIEAPWVGERRRELADLRLEARMDAGRLAYEEGRYKEAADLAAAVLEEDPYRERAWRLAMRVAAATGDEDGVIGAFRGCAGALEQLGAEPSQSTRRLLSTLRR